MRSLSQAQVSELRELYKSGNYTKKQLAGYFECSPTTIALWIPLDESKRTLKFQYRRKRQIFCFKCTKAIKGHPRCKYCTILLHGEKGSCSKCKLEHK